MIIIRMNKAEKGNWDDLLEKKSKIKPPSETNDTDPSAGLMNLMKEMYQDGDPEMKRTIAKAWVYY